MYQPEEKKRKKRLDSTWICENVDEFTTNIEMNINPHEQGKKKSFFFLHRTRMLNVHWKDLQTCACLHYNIWL